MAGKGRRAILASNTGPKGCRSNLTAFAMIFTLVDSVQETWRKLVGHNRLPSIIQGCEVYRWA